MSSPLLSNDGTSSSVKTTPKRLTKVTIGMIGCIAVLASVLSAVTYEISRVHQQVLADLNAKLSQKPRSADGSEFYDQLVKKNPEALASAIAIIQQNRKLGITPWVNLDPLQVHLICGYAPISLFYIGAKGVAPVYFDEHRNGIIFSFEPDNRSNCYSKSLSDISPELQSIATKFHLRESKYLPGIYGLDPAYLDEAIDSRVLPVEKDTRTKPN